MSRLNNGGIATELADQQPTPEAERVLNWLLHHAGTVEIQCERLLDAQVKQVYILDPSGVELLLNLDEQHEELITVQCPWQGEVDVEWRYQSTTRNGDEEQVGDWTCPVCGETQEVTR
jgi:hypothetical protein